MDTHEIEKLEEETFFEDNYEQIPPSDIVAYNELRSCSDIFRMYSNGSLKIYTDFQREIVWPPASQTRFIDSLIKQLPIPSMCFSYDYKTEKWQVIDGLQRISSIIKFLSDDDWKLSNLGDINPDLSGVTVKEIKETKRLLKYYQRVENITLPITVLRCDYGKKSHKLYLFTIFHRLNTGGMRLNNQEIRNCIYSGKFNDLLKELDLYDNWKKLNKIKPKIAYRFAKQELILRFFAFYDKLDNYNGRLARFLNEYMSENQNPNKNFMDEKREVFFKTVDLIFEVLFQENIQHKLSNTLLEALLYGVSKNSDSLESKNSNDMQKCFNLLRGHKAFSDESLREGLSSKGKVLKRLDTAKVIFSAK